MVLRYGQLHATNKHYYITVLFFMNGLIAAKLLVTVSYNEIMIITYCKYQTCLFIDLPFFYNSYWEIFLYCSVMECSQK